MKALFLPQIRASLLAAGLITLTGAAAHATCAKVDDFSHTYPAYDPTWSQDDCEAYAASGIGHCYIFGGDAGWGGSQEGVDCSAYCSRVWAIPGHINKTVAGAQPVQHLLMVSERRVVPNSAGAYAFRHSE